ncbi:dual specificity protein phosphatase 16 [Stylonychia lemnae]|uniref:protein-tyrosine-phosphatase n=1 Tax=Stylonychia lemnae TaxID=5949 RepID=A0A078AK49_STYLE|nr:dual specificity protein phosphatase 16 [Stylonychia lemnae]|eukprot:CDW82554.1 dual specificity protein phosphatase 16 [Stylonychia lemnae]
MSRSATIVISYVMISTSIPANEAIKFVQKKHSKTYPNQHFIEELIKLEKQLKAGRDIQKLPFEIQKEEEKKEYEY